MRSASIISMIRHYVARRAKVIEDHPHNAEMRTLPARISIRRLAYSLTVARSRQGSPATFSIILVGIQIADFERNRSVSAGTCAHMQIIRFGTRGSQTAQVVALLLWLTYWIGQFTPDVAIREVRMGWLCVGVAGRIGNVRVGVCGG